MAPSVFIGLMSLAGLFGYLAGALQGVAAMERQWRDGYAAGARAAHCPAGGDHG